MLWHHETSAHVMLCARVEHLSELFHDALDVPNGHGAPWPPVVHEESGVVRHLCDALQDGLDVVPQREVGFGHVGRVELRGIVERESR